MRLLVTRPERDGQALSLKLEALGHTPTLMPLLDIAARGQVVIPAGNFQAVCATSANGLRCAQGLEALSHVPAFTVGPHSLAAARAAGFSKASAHGGDVHGLARHLIATLNPGDGAILYLSGAEVSGDLKGLLEAAGFEVCKIVVYDAVALVPPGIEEMLAGHDGVLLFSPRSARLFVGLASDEAACRLRYFCLSAAVAEALPQSWRRHIAATPDEESLLALLD